MLHLTRLVFLHCKANRNKYTAYCRLNVPKRQQDEQVEWTPGQMSPEKNDSGGTKPGTALDSLAPVPVTRPCSLTGPNTTALKHYPLSETLICGSMLPRPCLTEHSGR